MVRHTNARTNSSAGVIALTAALSIAGMALGGCGTSQGSTSDSSELVGTAALAITNAPADGTCIEVTAVGNRTVTRSFAVKAGASSVFTLGGLPEGQVTFTAEAFSGTCPPPAADDAGNPPVPTWVSAAPFTTTVGVRPPVLVTLNLVRNGNAAVSLNFDDDAGSSSTSTDAGSGSSSGGTTGSGNRAFMQIPGATGGETQVPGFVGAYDVDELDLGVTVAVSSSTGGGGAAGKPALTVSANLPAQTGTPALYNFASTGKALSTVTFSYVGPGPIQFTFYSVKLTNAIISSVTASSVSSGDRAPELTVAFAFQKIDVTLTAQNADGSAGAATVVSFDLSTNAGGGSPGSVPFDFAIGAPPPSSFEEATSFLAPAETNASSSSTGTGSGAGKPVFAPASVSLPLDVSVLTDLQAVLAGAHIPSGSVELFATGSTTPYGTYGFTNVTLDALSLAGTSATVGFVAQKYSWTFGSDTSSFDTSTGQAQ